MSSQVELAPVARLDFVARGSGGPGWYIRYLVDGQPVSERLTIEIGADAFGAIEEAAHYLKCRVDQIEFGGPVWPKPLDGLVDANETLEYVANRHPRVSDHDGNWRRLARTEKDDVDARRFERRKIKNMILFGPVTGRVLNLSDAGMGIEIARPLRLETRDLFVAKNRDSEIELHGEVRWCRMVDAKSSNKPPVYQAGITIIR